MGLLLIVEVILRLTGSGYSNSPTDADHTLNWVHPANYEYKLFGITGEFQDFIVYFDSLHRRNQVPAKAIAHPPGTKQIAFLGDSFVEALQVPYDSCFVGLLADQYRDISFLNYGVTGYGPVLYYLQCKKMLEEHAVRPAAVCMVLYSNDVRDDSSFLPRAVYHGNQIVAINGGDKNYLLALLRKSYLARLCNKVYLQWKYSRKMDTSAAGGNKLVKGTIEENPSLNNTLSEEYILKTDSMLRAWQIPFYITAIPSKYINFTADTTVHTFAQQAAGWSSAHSIPFINLSPHFDSLGVQAQQKLFFDIDIHCNARGHRAIADVMGKEIKELKTSLYARHQQKEIY